MSHVVIFTDGACKGNPGYGGWGAIIADDERVVELGGAEKNTTNNRMELRAAIEALSVAKRFRDAQIVVHADSSYVVDGTTKWSKGWRLRNWMTSEKKPVLNRDLWEPLLALADALGTRLTWKVVGGHIGIQGNERADEIASSFALGAPSALYQGSRADYAVDLEDLSHDSELRERKRAGKSRSSTKAYSYVSEVDGVIKTHATWRECEERVRGKKARFRKALSAQEEANIIRAFSA